MATEGGQRAGDSPDSDDSMDGKRPNLSAEESADSDDSMDGKRPNLPAEERALLDNLLKISNNFIRLYEELQPQLQQNIDELLTHSKTILDEHTKIKELHRASRRIVVRAGVSAGLGALALSAFLFLFLFIDDPSLSDEFFTAGVGVAWAAVVFGVTSYIRSKKNQNKLTELFEKMKDATKGLLTTAERGTSCQKNICDLAEKILQCYSKFSQRKHQNEDLKARADALAELAQLFKPDDLWRFVKEKRTYIWKEKLDALVPPVPLIIPKIKGSRTTKVSKTVKKRGAAQERVRESQAGRPEQKMREAAKHLRKIVKELKTSQSEVEKELLHKHRELIIQ